jgi:guanylate kinase
MNRKENGQIFVFSAASGGGKTTILNHLRSAIPGLVYSISVTTRPPRQGEIDGVHYFFVSKEKFEDNIKADVFAEWAMVHDHYYGTPRKFIDDTVASGRHIVMDIDVFGKIKFDKVYPRSIGILLLPPSLEILEKRLRARNTDDEATIRLRLANAQKEMAFARSNGKYEFTIVNDDLDAAKAQAEGIVKRSIQTT